MPPKIKAVSAAVRLGPSYFVTTPVTDAMLTGAVWGLKSMTWPPLTSVSTVTGKWTLCVERKRSKSNTPSYSSTIAC
jgi:hypothetical protein